MKKAAIMFLTFVMILSLVACSGGESQSTTFEDNGRIYTSVAESTSSESHDSKNSETAVTSAAESASSESHEKTDTSVAESTSSESHDSQSSETAVTSAAESASSESHGKTDTSVAESTASGHNQVDEHVFEEIIVVDNDQCLIKITGIDPDNMWGYAVKAYMENKSGDKTYMFSITRASVNGVQTETALAAEIAAGKKSNEEIYFFGDDLSSHGIDTFTDIELSFRVYDFDDWFADAVAEETIHIYPYGENQATPFVREAQPTDTVLVDNEKVSVIVTDYDEDGFWGYTVNLFLVNKTDKELTYSVDDASVNGFMADPFWAASIGAGKAAFSSMSWFDSDFEENGITVVEEIEMNFKIYDPEDWSSDAIFEEVIILNP